MFGHEISSRISRILWVLDHYCLLTILKIESLNPSKENVLAFKQSTFFLISLLKLLFL